MNSVSAPESAIIPYTW
ncbi:hypothetical protein EC960109_2987A, partial [Escherichia coli 96.0109]